MNTNADHMAIALLQIKILLRLHVNVTLVLLVTNVTLMRMNVILETTSVTAYMVDATMFMAIMNANVTLVSW